MNKKLSSSERKNLINAARKRAKEAFRKVPSPRLSTIKMVENVLEEEGHIKIAALKRKLPKQVNHNTLIAVLEYLEESNKIYSSVKGISWLVNDSPKLKAALRKSRDFDEILAEIEAKYKLSSVFGPNWHERNKSKLLRRSKKSF